MSDAARAFFRYEAFFTILAHLKLKFSKSVHWLVNTKTVIPLSVGA